MRDSHPKAHSDFDSALHPRALAVRPYDRGLHELGNGIYAWLQPDGSWGWSNAGLIASDAGSLLVDTLFDLHLTHEMLGHMRRADARAQHIATVVNTHANPDHTNGNSLLQGATVIASARAAAEMARDAPALLAGVMRQARVGSDALSEYFVHCFGAFDFEGIPHSVPDRSFSGRLGLELAGKRVELIELGAAHTGGDIIIHVPDDRIVFTGDLLFVGGHPVMWAGPIENWIAACDHLLALDVDLVVPGHGPITDKRGVRAVRDYLVLVRDAAAAAHAAGVNVESAAHAVADELSAAGFGAWLDGERVLATVTTLYRQRSADASPADLLALFAGMARFRQARRALA